MVMLNRLESSLFTLTPALSLRERGLCKGLISRE